MLSRLKKLFTRQQPQALGERSEWVPFSNNFPPTSATRLATVGRCLRLYSDFLLQCKLEPANHYISKLLQKPNSFDSKKTFYEKLTFELLLNGNFHAKIKSDETGKVKALLPYRAGQVYCYPVKGEYSDPISLEENGFYYLESKGRTFMPDEMFHLKDMMFNTSDDLNGLSRIYLYELAFSAGYSVQTVQNTISKSGLKKQLLITGLPQTSPDAYKKSEEYITKYVKSGQATQGGALMLPGEFTLQNMTLDQPDKLLEFLASKSDLDICRIFNVPIEILSRSDSKTAGGTNHLKESHRFFLKTSLKPFLQGIADALSELAMDGTSFEYKTSPFQASDLREQSMYLSQLVGAKILTPQQAKEMLQ